MNVLGTLFIFLLALFLYIYLMHQYKKSGDLEIYEMDYQTNVHLQEVCDIRQPIIFDIRPISSVLFQEISPPMLAKYGGQSVEIKDVRDYAIVDSKTSTTDATIDGASISFSLAKQICDMDDQSRYFSENNEDFLDTTGMSSRLTEVDTLLKPSFTVSKKHDLLFGSRDTATPLQYHTYYRRFFCVALGRIRVSMVPWKMGGSLQPIHDYEHYEFRSPVDLRSLSSDILEFDVAQGSVLFIPPYWWYSIRYVDPGETMVYSTSYMTAMNLLANIPNLGLYWLQQQNIRPKVSKMLKMDLTVDKPELSKDEKDVMEGEESGLINGSTDSTSPVAISANNTQIVKVDPLTLPSSKLTEEVISTNNI